VRRIVDHNSSARPRLLARAVLAAKENAEQQRREEIESRKAQAVWPTVRYLKYFST